MIDVQAIRKAKKVLDRLNYKVEEANQRISQLTKSAEAYEQWAKEKAQEAAEAPLRAPLGKIELAAYYVKAAAKARTDLEIWEQRHCDALAHLRTAAGNYDEAREGLPEDIDQRVEIMDKYELEWFFSADRWVIDPLKCSLETFEMLCDLERRTNDALWHHFCKGDYEWESEDLEEIPSQWQKDRIANAEAFIWSCRIDADWYDQEDFEEIALETPIVEFQDRLWDFFDEVQAKRTTLEAEAEPEVKCLSEDIFAGIDVGSSEPISHIFTIYEPDPAVLKLFFPEPISDEVKDLYFGKEADQEEVWFDPEATQQREGVAFEDLFEWAKQNSERLPSPETEAEKIFRALFGREG